VTIYICVVSIELGDAAKVREASDAWCVTTVGDKYNGRLGLESTSSP
jgi:hypothetical protein